MPEQTILAELLVHWEEMTARGQEPAVEELCRDCPELAGALGQRIEVMKRWLAGRAANDARTERPGEGAAEQPPTFLQVAGYEVLEEIGRGGMGVVYKARQVALDRIVALKMILAGSHAGAVDRQRFQREAEAIARLQHPHIVSVFEVRDEGGLPFYSMEFCPGGSLAERLAGTPLPGQEAARLVQVLAQAVDRAHQAGVVHRDLKPANVLMSAACGFAFTASEGNSNLPSDGANANPPAMDGAVPKIADFGLAKRLDAGDAHTCTDALLGTPSYMPPSRRAA
jgi:serine/threonine protein kinase